MAEGQQSRRWGSGPAPLPASWSGSSLSVLSSLDLSPIPALFCCPHRYPPEVQSQARAPQGLQDEPGRLLAVGDGEPAFQTQPLPQQHGWGTRLPLARSLDQGCGPWQAFMPVMCTPPRDPTRITQGDCSNPDRGNKLEDRATVTVPCSRGSWPPATAAGNENPNALEETPQDPPGNQGERPISS